MNAPQQKSSTGLWVTSILLGLLLLLSLAVNAGFFVGHLFSWMEPLPSDLPVDEQPQFEEVWSYGQGESKAVRIALDGVIMREPEGGLFAGPYDRIEQVLRQVRAATQDDEVRAIIMEINSPGGGITASDEIYQSLVRFRESDEERKVVIYMKDLCVSGGYYVAAAGDFLIAEPTTIVGSIGVIMQALNWKGLSEKIGLSATVIKSGQNKDLLNPFEEVSEEQKLLLQEMVDTMYDRFVGIVQQARGIPEEQLATLADGRIFSAEDALRHDLVDATGYWDDVLAKTAELLGEDDLYVVRYQESIALWTWLAGARVPRPLSYLRETEAPRLLYLWQP